MSEYQYYEFRAIDRPLTQTEMRELRALSTRAEITPTSFTNEYHWGDFKGRPEVLMEKYFDAHLYFANWGTRRLMLRLPCRLLDVEQAALYCPGDGASIRVTEEFVILEWVYHTENGDYDDDGEEDENDGGLASLIPLRAELMNGDVRALYLGWLLYAQLCDPEEDEAEVEPPVPPGLGRLNGTLKRFASFLRIDRDLIAVAAEASADSAPAAPSREEWTAWIERLPESEKNALLLRVVQGGDAHLVGELLRRFRQERIAAGLEQDTTASGRRTVAELLAAAEQHAEKRKRREAEQRSAEKARREREEQIARAAYLETLAGREPGMWLQAEALIAAKRPAEYDKAVALLVDLRDLSVRNQGEGLFRQRIEELRARHATKTSFLARLEKASLGARR